MEEEHEQQELKRREILIIFLYLPVKTLFRCRCLCRRHRSIIDNPLFSDYYNLLSVFDKTRSRRLFLQFYPHHPAAVAPSGFCPFKRSGEIDPGRCFTVVASCFSVLCLASTPYDVCLWNPSTQTHRHLSLPNYEHFDGVEGLVNRLVNFGIGCDVAGHAKLIRFVVSFSQEAHAFRGEAAIYSARTNTWQAINCQGLAWNFYVEGLDDQLVNAWEFGKSGVCAFETIYWVVKLYNHQNGAGEFRILSFYLEGYTFVTQTIPPIMMSANPLDPLLNIDLWAFDGKLSSSCQFGGESPRVVVWVNERGTGTWRNLLVVDGFFRRLKPLFYSQDKKKVLLQMDSKIMWYDLETTEYGDADVDQHGSLLYNVEVYFESLLLINDVGRCLRS